MLAKVIVHRKTREDAIFLMKKTLPKFMLKVYRRRSIFINQFSVKKIFCAAFMIAIRWHPFQRLAFGHEESKKMAKLLFLSIGKKNHPQRCISEKI